MNKSWKGEPIFFTPPATKLNQRRYKDAPDPPAPDPRIADIMQQQVGLSKETLDFVKQAYADNKPRQAALDEMNLNVGNSLLQDASINRQRSQEQYDNWKQNYLPMEQRVLSDANNIDSAANIDHVRGRALADVNSQFGMAQQEAMRSMSRFGLRPNSARMASLANQYAAAQAATGAGAMINAEDALHQQGMGLRANAANFGRGYPMQALQFSQGAGQAGAQAINGQAVGMNAVNANNAQMVQGFGMAGNMLGNAANTGLQMNQQQLQGWMAQQNADSNSSAGFGSLVGQLGSAALLSGKIFSSKDFKRDRALVDDNAVLDSLSKVPVQTFAYKDDQTGARHIGPMAEDMQKQLGSDVAPGGKMIDVVSAFGAHHAAIRALKNRLDDLEAERKGSRNMKKRAALEE